MAEFGTLVHQVLQDWANGKLEIYELLDEYENKYNQIVVSSFPNLRNGENLGDRYYEDGRKFFSEFSGIENYKIIGVEERFEIQIEDFVFNGFIDLLLEDDQGNIIVFDWKSKNGFENDEEEAKYRRQLYLYSYYVNEKYGKLPSKTIFYCFRIPQKYEKLFDQDAYNEAVSWMFDTVSSIKMLYCQYDFFKCANLCNSRFTCKVKQEVESNPYWKQVIKDSKPKRARATKTKKKEG